jgi:hypothetical protein
MSCHFGTNRDDPSAVHCYAFATSCPESTAMCSSVATFPPVARRFLPLLLVGLVAASLVVVTRPADAVTQQFLWYDQQVTHTDRSYATPTQSAATPDSWTSPVNYAGGRVYTRFQVLSKPSSKPLDVQICVWRDRFTKESCAPIGLRFANEGTYYIDFGSPSSWWKLNGSWSWSIPFEPTRWMVKDPNTGKLMQTANCGSYCSTPSAVNGHVPMTFDVAAVVVAAGATLDPPADWTGCPAAWSPQCSGGGGTTTTTRPTATSTTSTTAPSTGNKVALVVGNAASIPAKDVPIRNRLVALGKAVQLVDDDNLGSSAALGSPDLVVISSSVVPSKVPAWLATYARPVLDLEVHVQDVLRIGTQEAELAGRTTLRIVSPGHALAAGRSGDVAVQSAVAMGASKPVPSATVIARIPGQTTASIFAVPAGAALTSGTAPARRVGFFFSYDSPAALNTAGWALFNAAVAWLD